MRLGTTHRSYFTDRFEQVVAWLSLKMNKTAVSRLMRVSWQTVGEIISRLDV